MSNDSTGNGLMFREEQNYYAYSIHICMDLCIFLVEINKKVGLFL